jgi:hypothetical protein
VRHVGVLACNECGVMGEECDASCHWGPPIGSCAGSETVDPESCPDAAEPFCDATGMCVAI